MTKSALLERVAPRLSHYEEYGFPLSDLALQEFNRGPRAEEYQGEESPFGLHFLTTIEPEMDSPTLDMSGAYYDENEQVLVTPKAECGHCTTEYYDWTPGWNAGWDRYSYPDC